MTSLINPFNIKHLYIYMTGKKKDKLDYILEPLQAMLQLSMLNYCDVGSKLTIQDNILYIQLPGVSQGFVRFFNDDKKDDLYYLFNVFRRFFTYYKSMNKSTKHQHLYNILIKMAGGGLDKLIQTYTDTEKISVLHTLQMYKVMLNKPDFFDPDNKNTNMITLDNIPNFDKSSLLKNSNIDNIFDKIINIYSNEELTIIYNTLLLMKKKDNNSQCYINGLNIMLNPTYKKIKKWINDNIAL